MIKNIYYLNEFAKLHKKQYVVELPIKVQSDNYPLILKERYKEYESLLKDFLVSHDGEAIWEDVKDDLTYLYESFIDVIEGGSYENFRKCLEEIDEKRQLIKSMKKTLDKVDYYRFCSYSTKLTEPKHFYHCPITRRGMNTRFGIADIPLWYLGCSKDVCMYEAAGCNGSLAVFRQKDSTEPINIIDLTQKGCCNKDEDLFPLGICYLFWWILACCYCFLDNDNHEQTSTIPQMFAKYIRENYKDISGIRYYTVRNSQLNPNEDTYVNVALFTREYNAEGYDICLCEKFEMVRCEQNVKTK